MAADTRFTVSFTDKYLQHLVGTITRINLVSLTTDEVAIAGYRALIFGQWGPASR